jgi:tetratricopeptide (TPR) repeat protein
MVMTNLDAKSTGIPTPQGGGNVTVSDHATVFGPVVGFNTGTITNIIQVAQAVTSSHQLRAPLDDFVGRFHEMTMLVESLRSHADGAAIAAICGMGGLGKSELALKIAHELSVEYPDAQLFVNLRGSTPSLSRTPADGLRDVIRAFARDSILPAETDALAALYRGYLGGKRVLVLLDDAPDNAAVRAFFPPAGCALIVTSRTRLTLDGQGSVLDLMPLERAEARKLLLDDIPSLDNTPLLDDLLNYCGDLPLAVRIAGATLSNSPELTLERYLARLANDSRRSAALRYEDTDVYAILGAGDDILMAANPDLARRWRILGVCPAPFDATAAGSIWGETDVDERDDALAQLVRRSLLSFDKTSRRYRMHDLLRDIARSRCSIEDNQAARIAHARYYLQIYRHAQNIHESSSVMRLEGLRLFDAIWPHIRAAVMWIAANPSPETDLLCVYELSDMSLLDIRLEPGVLATWCAAAVAAAHRRNEPSHEAAALFGLAYSNFLLGELEQAKNQYSQSLDLFRTRSDRTGEIRALLGKGKTLQQLGEYPGADELYQQALSIAETIQDHYAIACIQRERGNLLAYTNSYDEARALLEKAHTDIAALGDTLGLSSVLEYLGYVATKQNDYAAACRYAQEQLDIAERHGDRIGMCMALNTLGIAGWQQGNVREGLEYLQRQLEIAVEIGYMRGVCFAHSDIAGVYSTEGNYYKALAHLNDALVAAIDTDDRTGISTILGNAGLIYSRCGHYDVALTCLGNALKLLADLGEWPESYFLLISIADAYKEKLRFDHAARLYSHAIALTRALTTQSILGEALYQQADLYIRQERYTEALPLIDEAISILQRENFSEYYFPAMVLAVRLRFVLRQIDYTIAVSELANLHEQCNGESDQAALYYEIWRSDPHQRDAGQSAADLYKQLYVRSPQIEYRRRYEELTHTQLTETPPLPILSMSASLESVDIDILSEYVIRESSRAVLHRA